MYFDEKNAIKFDYEYSRNCVYFLLEKNVVVYVGKTTNGIWRIKQHRHEKTYDDIYIIKCNYEDLNRLEDYYMIKYKPKYNLLPNHYRKNIITCYNELRKEFSTPLLELIDYIKQNNIKIDKFNNVESITKADYLKIKEHFMKQNL